MILKFNGPFFSMGGVFRGAFVSGGAQELDVVLNDDPIVQDRGVSGRLEFGTLETWPGEENVVGLELSRFAAGVHQRGRLPVNCGGLAVGIGLVFVAVENLDLILSKKENAAIAPALARSLRGSGGCPLHMQLEIGSKFFGRFQVTSPFDGYRAAFFDRPIGFFTNVLFKLGEIFSIEKNHGIAGGVSRVDPRRDDLGLWAQPIVHVPVRTRNEGGILISKGFSVLRQSGGGERGGKKKSLSVNSHRGSV